MDIVNALLELAPGAQWTINADDYDQITWLSPDIPQPTREQVEAKIEELGLNVLGSVGGYTAGNG